MLPHPPTHPPPTTHHQTLSNLLWGYCKLDVYPQELFEAAAAELVERFRTPELARQFRAQELSNALYVRCGVLCCAALYGGVRVSGRLAAGPSSLAPTHPPRHPPPPSLPAGLCPG